MDPQVSPTLGAARDETEAYADGIFPPEKALAHLLGARITAADRVQSVRDWINEALLNSGRSRVVADSVLERIGLKLAYSRGQRYLAVANYNDHLAVIFGETPWAGRCGVLSMATRSLRELPGARAGNSGLRFEGVQIRVTFVPLALV